MDSPSFLQRPLISKGSEPLLWIGATIHPSCHAPSLSLVCLNYCHLLLPCSPWGQEPSVPGPRHPPWRVLSGFLSPPGSHRHPLGSASVPQRAPCAFTSLGATLLRSPVVITHCHLYGACPPWRAAWTFRGVRASLECKGTAAQRAIERPLLPCGQTGLGTCQPPFVGFSPISVFAFPLLDQSMCH